MLSEVLEKSRKELLDLSFRNRLISYKESKRYTINIIQESSKEVFKILVTDGHKMSFETIDSTKKSSSKREDQSASGDSDADDEIDFIQPDENEVDASKLTDLILQTSHSDTELQKRLRSISSTSKSSIEEQGFNVLFLALGFLKWYESDSGTMERMAPLVLIPVQLNRSNIRSRFTLSYNEEEVGVNISLLEKLKVDFGIKISPPDDTTDLDIEAFFKTISEEIKTYPRWSISNNEIRLGFFAFTKFMMYNDLNTVNWPDDKKPFDHNILSKILGTGFTESEKILPREFGDEVKYQDLYHVLPADSSQQDVILSIREGSNMVVQGPPGTGKSQTITNIIADFVARGKKVLFVAEKMAALNVVANRLNTLGIGDIALELHSYKSKKKEVLKELERTHRLDKPTIPKSVDEIFSNAEYFRNKLNDYSRAVNTPIQNSGFTPIQAFGYILKSLDAVGEGGFIEIDVDEINTGSKDDFLNKRQRVYDVQASMKKIGPKVSSPFYGIQTTELDFISSKKFIEKVELSLSQLETQLEQIQTIDKELPNLPNKRTLFDLKLHEKTIQALSEKPLLFTLQIDHKIFHNSEDTVRLKTFFESGLALSSSFTKTKDQVYSKVWDESLFETKINIDEHHSKWYWFLIPSYKKSIKKVRSYFKNPKSVSRDEVSKLTKLVVDIQEFKNAINERLRDLAGLLPSAPVDLDYDWKEVLDQIVWRIKIEELISEKSVFDEIILVNKQVDQESLKVGSEVLATTQKLLALIQEIFEECKYESDDIKIDDLENVSLYDLKDKLKLWVENKESLQDYIQLLKNTNLLDRDDLSWVKKAVEDWDKSHEHLIDHFQYYWFSKLGRIAFGEHEVLSRFDGAIQRDIIEKFIQVEDEVQKLNTFRVLDSHWKSLPSASQQIGKLGLLKSEFSKKRKQLPIRQLLLKAGEVIQDIKPVFMMSPMSIAQYIPQGGIEFDLVLFDEASQIKPVEAFGSILRGKQVVVVGDSKQLPPTSFFDSILSEDDEDENEEEYITNTADMESILTLFAAKNVNEKMLRWHYRSKHESLIAVSNYEFYDSNLFVFPTAYQDDPLRGLQLRHLPETTYTAGKGGRVNREEANHVVQQVIEHAQKTPHLSLGVAAFSQTQARLIEDLLEKILLDSSHPKVEEFINQNHPDEPFFIKNLENVQGDERDVIFISVGYGKQENGKLSMNFGPINKDGGERRLNVLFTRSKQRCVVFSNLKSELIDTSRSDSIGVKAFKQFLQFAHNRQLEMPSEFGGEADSIFEEQVANALVRNGYDIVNQVGTAGFRIDIGVKHPKDKGRFILAVECDGASYHSSRIARDRDKTRQAVLESQGWVFHRIWSTDWFNNPKRETERLLQTLEYILSSESKESKINKTTTSNQEDEKPLKVTREAVEQSTFSIAEPYKKTGRMYRLADPLHEFGPSQYAGWIKEILAEEHVIHKDIALIRILELTGTKRAGNRIVDSFNYCLEYIQRNNVMNFKNDFLYENLNSLTVRDRSDLPRAEKNFKYIHSAEIQLGIKKLLEFSYGASSEDIVKEVPKLLGFTRIDPDIQKRMVKELKALEKSGSIQLKDGVYENKQ